MALAYDAISNATAGTGNLSWTHTPVGTPKGVAVYILQTDVLGSGDYSDQVTAVTYGGVSMTEVSSSPLTGAGTGADRGILYCYFLGASIPTGAQTVAVTCGTTVDNKQASCITITAASDTTLQNNATINQTTGANPSVNLALGGNTCFVLDGYTSGQNTVGSITDPSGWTSRRKSDLGSQIFGIYTYNTVSTADVSCGYTAATDDCTLIALAIKEAVVAITGTSALTQAKQTVSAIGGGVFQGTSALTQAKQTVSATGGHNPVATSLQIDRQTNPTTASEDPLFSAIWQAKGDSGTAAYAHIQVSANSDYSSPAWDSGWVAITNIADNTRSDEISYGGSYLSSEPDPDGQYYARMRFKDTDGIPGGYVTGTFKVTKRKWAPTMTEYLNRYRLLWNNDHPAIPAGYTQEFTLPTGNRTKIATNGFFNESIANSGGYQVCYYGNKTHVVYFAEIPYNATDSEIYIVSYDWTNQVWGTPVKIADSTGGTDTHYFPTLSVDTSGYIHVFYGCHGGGDAPVLYLRSELSNVTGSLAGETASWINPATGLTTPAEVGLTATYPISFTMPDTGRVYLLYRGLQFAPWADAGYSLNYSDDHGVTWSSTKTFIYDTKTDTGDGMAAVRIYMYGCRYDAVKKRLHIAWTHNQTGDIERGVWYAYSDYDPGQAEGFHSWKWADGTAAGTTATASSPSGAIDWTPTKAIILSRVYAIAGLDTNCLAFIENLILDQNGEPIVFWEQKLNGLGVFSDHTNICSAKWSANVGNSGSWATTYISDQTKKLHRVRRNGFATYTDTDGIIHIWMPVGGLSYYNLKTTGDGPDTAGTAKNGGSKYVEVDDGFSICDGDGSYVDIAGTTGKISFTTNETVPSSYTVVSVDVVASLAQTTASTSTVQMFLHNGTTYDYSANQTITDPTIGNAQGTFWTFYKSWTTNPFTAAAWAPSEVGALKFGVKNTGANNIRVSNVWLRVKYYNSTSLSTAGNEVYELTSTDGGTTWTAKEQSRNTLIGVPIFSQRHDLLNKDSLEVVWCSGNDIFYLNNDARYNLVQPSGMDLKLFYGTTEIDRIIDYGNIADTKIYFKVQGAISANRTAGAQDYIVYITNPNETTNPLANPSNVVTTLFENFETYTVGDIHGQGGWSITGGSNATVYSSPPSHSNKLYGGFQSLQIGSDSAATSISKSLGTNLQNVYIKFGLWEEYKDVADTHATYLQVTDNAANTFGVGVNTVGGSKLMYAMYIANGTKTSFSSDGLCKLNQYFIGELAVNTNGVSATLHNKRLTTENTTLTGVNSISLFGNRTSYFDYLWVMQRLSTSSLTNSRTSSFSPDNSITYSTNSTTTYESADAKVITLGSAITKLVVTLNGYNDTNTGTVTCKVQVCEGSTWDTTKVYTSTNATISPSNSNATITIASTGVTTASTTVTYSNMTPGPKTIKIDYFQYTNSAPEDVIVSIKQIDEYNMSTEPYITVQPMESHGFGIDASIFGSTVGYTNLEQGKQSVNTTGKLKYSGTSSNTQGKQSVSSTAKEIYSGTATLSQNNQSVSSNDQITYTGTSTVSQSSQSVSSIGTKIDNLGTVTPSQASQQVSSTGHLTYTGTSSNTQASQQVSSTGHLTYTGTSSNTQASQQVSSTGHLAYSGTSTPSQSKQSVSSTGKITYTASSVSLSQSSQQISSTGHLGYSGTASPVQGNQAVSSTGHLGYSGTSTVSQGKQSVSVTAKEIYSSTSTPAQSGQAVSSTGHLTYTGTAAPSQRSQAVSVAAFKADNLGATTSSQGKQSVSSTGHLTYTGTESVSEGKQSVSSTGNVSYPGTSTVSQGKQSVSSTGHLRNAGTSTTVQNNQAVSAVGHLAHSGTSGNTQSGQQVSATGHLTYTGTAAVSEGKQSVTSVGVRTNNFGPVSTTQNSQQVSASGHLTYTGTSTDSQGAQQVSSTGHLTYTGTSALTEGKQSTSSSGLVEIIIRGSADIIQTAPSVAGNVKEIISGTIALIQPGGGLGAPPIPPVGTVTIEVVQELLAAGIVNSPAVPPTDTTPKILTTPIGALTGSGPGGGGGSDARFRKSILPDVLKNRKKRPKRGTAQDDEEVMTIIAAFLEVMEDEENNPTMTWEQLWEESEQLRGIVSALYTENEQLRNENMSLRTQLHGIHSNQYS